MSGDFVRWILRAVALAGVMGALSRAAAAEEAGTAAAGVSTAAAGAAEDVAEVDDEEDEYAQPAVWDPFEKVNRTTFKFNDGLFRHVVRPVTRGYEAVTPAPVRRGLVSFFDNVKFPVRFVGSLLQGKVDRAAAETGKFVVNTTAGIGGFIKVSERFPSLRVPEEDIGQALGAWGLPAGPFIVLPVLGPANPREIVGRVGDYVLTPTTWEKGSIMPEELEVMDELSWEWDLALSGLDTLSALPGLVAAYDSFSKSAVDPYIAFRNGFLQYREAVIRK